MHDGFVAQLALWQRRWIDAEEAVRDGLARMRSREAAQLRVWFCAEGLRAQAELAALARARRDADGERDRLGRARKLTPPRAAPPPRRRRSRRTRPAGARWPTPSTSAPAAPRGPSSGRTPPATWEGSSARRSRRTAGGGRPRHWSRPVRSRAEASVPLRQAHAVAARIGAAPLARELELLAGRARLDLTPPEANRRTDARPEESSALPPGKPRC